MTSLQSEVLQFFFVVAVTYGGVSQGGIAALVGGVPLQQWMQSAERF